MIPQQTLTPYPEFGNNATKVKPDDPKYAAGFLPADVLPAEWLNWFLNRSSRGVSELGAGVDSMEKEIINVLAAGEQEPDAEDNAQLLAAIIFIINQVRLEEQQMPAVGVPTLWMGAKPDWALDFGNGAATKYLWSNYPKLNNTRFKGILSTLSTAGWMTAHDDSGFYVPDLRGVAPIGYGTNAKRTDHTYNGGSSVGTWTPASGHYHTHNRGSMEIATTAGIRLIHDSASGTVNNGPFTYTSVGTTGATGSSDSIISLTFKASNSWSGSTSGPGGSTDTKMASKPGAVACMWIVRFE